MVSDWNRMALPRQRVITMVRNEKVITKRQWAMDKPISSSGRKKMGKLTNAERDAILIKLAEIHGITV